MFEVLVPVSIGELVDKITILRIKERRIHDPSKVANIKKELDALIKVCQRLDIPLQGPLVEQLETINEQLWTIEDEIRELERQKKFDGKFIELARAVYITNDQRFQVKSALNQAFGSAYQEEKSYQKYE